LATFLISTAASARRLRRRLQMETVFERFPDVPASEFTG